MHILILNWRDIKNPKAGGAEIVTMQHAKAWIRRGNKVTWFTSLFGKASKESFVDGVRIVRRGNSLTTYFFGILFYFFSKEKYDIVIDEIHGIPYFTPFFVKKPKLAFIHEVAGEIWNYMYPFPLNIFGRVIEKYYFSLYKHIPFWTDAQSTQVELEKFGIPKKNISIIACPINNIAIRQLPKKEKVPTYIFVSRLVKMKGIETVLDTFSKIIEKQKFAKLWIVGGGDPKYVLKLNQLVKEKNMTRQVIFLGKVSEQKKLQLMRKAHILLHASVKEGWGLVVIEAASQATPAVVYNVGGLRDSVKNNLTGVVLKTNNSQEMATEAIKLYEDRKRYKKMQKNCVVWAKSFSWSKSTAQSLSLLNKVISG